MRPNPMTKEEVRERWEAVRPIFERGGCMREAAEKLDITSNSLRGFLRRHYAELGEPCKTLCARFIPKRVRRETKQDALIAVYHGDEFYMMGTRAEIIKAMHIKPDTVTFYLSPAYARRASKSDERLHMFYVDDDEED